MTFKPDDILNFIEQTAELVDEKTKLEKAAESVKEILEDENVKKMADSAKAFRDLIAKDVVNESTVSGMVFDLYVELYRADMMKPVIEACGALLKDFEDAIDEWARDTDKKDLLEELLAPVQVRRLQLANVDTARKLTLKQTTYKVPYEWKTGVEVMENLKWLKKELREKGFEPQLMWDKFYDFLLGYDRTDTGKVYVKGGSIFGDESDGGLLYDLDEDFKREPKYDTLEKEWLEFKDDITNFNDKNDWDRPEKYSELADKLETLFQDMQKERETFESYLPGAVQLKRKIEKLEEEDQEKLSRIEGIEEKLKVLETGISVAVIEGIGPTYAKALGSIGIEYVHQLITADPKTIADAIKVNEETVKNWQKAGTKLILGHPT